MTLSSRNPDRGALATGTVLILLGLAFLAGQALNVDVGHYGWPFFVIVPGVVLLALGLILAGPPGFGLTVVGSITAMTGLVLLYQNATDHWESWAYAWALIAPGSVGLAMLLHGLVAGDRDLVDAGTRTTAVGLALFLVFGIFFEDVIAMGDNPPAVLRDVILPGGLVLLGAAIVLGGALSDRSRSSRDPGPTPGA